MSSEETAGTESDCPLCGDREGVGEHWIEIATLSVSTLYLDRNQTYRGQCALAFDPRHVEGLEELDSEEFEAFSSDLRRAAMAVSRACSPDRMNYASLGNVVPHLHWHIVPRYRSDPRWGAPIYTTRLDEMERTSLEDEEYEVLVGILRGALAEST